MNISKTYIQKPIIAILIVSFIMISNSCSLFRKKNKCDTCPTWSFHPSDVKGEFS